MIAGYRRIPFLISNNVRLLFCDTSKLSPNHRKQWPRELLKNLKTGKSATSEYDYQMLSIRENVRVLLICNPKKDHAEQILCAIRVGVGAEEDPNNIKGRAHLLEHILCNMSLDFELRAGARTWPFYTVYLFPFKKEGYDKVIEQWSKLFFSDKDLETIKPGLEGRIEQERERIDLEFHEMRCHEQSYVDRVVEIVKMYGLNVAKFRWGNRNTLRESSTDRLKDELNSLRKLYRQRPVNICIYSAEKLDMEVILKSWNFEHFLQKGKATEAMPIAWTERHTSDTDFSQNLIVLKSEDDSVQFYILFPLKAPLNCKQSNTLKFLCEMISLGTDGSLQRCLFEKKWATSCMAQADLNAFFITVNLTTGPTGGLKQITIVEKTIRNYLTFLHREWAKLSEFEYRKNWNKQQCDALITKIDYVFEIASHFDEENEEFDEKALFEGSSDADERDFINVEILNNQKKIFAVSARNPELVLQELNIQSNSTTGTEHIFGINYSISKTDLFTKPIHGLESFKLEDLRKLKSAKKAYRILTLNAKPKDVAFERLCRSYIQLQVSRFWTIGDLGAFGIADNFLVYYHPSNALPVEQFLKDFKPFQMDKEQFNMHKQALMGKLSVEMINPRSFAESLMNTAVENVYNKVKKDPVPMQYQSLMDLNAINYKKHFLDQHSKIVKANVKNQVENYDVKCVVRTMNRNEMNTVTLLFHQTDDLSEAEEFSPLLRKLTEKIVRGLLFLIRSVEHGSGHKHLQICELMTQTMETDLPEIVRNEAASLTPACEKLIKRKICIQVMGQDKLGENDVSFGSQFQPWFEHYRPEIVKLYV